MLPHLELTSLENEFNRPEGFAHAIHSDLNFGSSSRTATMISVKTVLSGTEVYKVDGRVYKIRPKQILMTPAEAHVDVDISARARGICLYLPEEKITQYWAEANSNDLEGDIAVSKNVVIPMDMSIEKSALSDIFHDIARRGSPDLDWMVCAYVDTQRKLHNKSNKLNERKQSTRLELLHRVEIARAYMHDNTMNLIELDELAKEAGLSRYHLARTFKLIYNIPPLRYHQKLRLQLAKRLITKGVKPTEVAEQLGFSTINSFSRAYFREHQVRPSLQ